MIVILWLRRKGRDPRDVFNHNAPHLAALQVGEVVNMTTGDDWSGAYLITAKRWEIGRSMSATLQLTLDACVPTSETT